MDFKKEKNSFDFKSNQKLKKIDCRLQKTMLKFVYLTLNEIF